MFITCSVCHFTRPERHTINGSEMAKPFICARCNLTCHETLELPITKEEEQFFVPRPPPLFEELDSGCESHP